MTLFHRGDRICPKCQNEASVVIWDRVNIEEDPDLKDRLLRKQLLTYDCENCGEMLTLSEPLLYMEPAAGLMVYLTPQLAEWQTSESGQDTAPGDEPAEAAGLAGVPETWLAQLNQTLGEMPGVRNLRLVGSVNELIEKVHLSDHHVDDRVMAILKVALKARYRADDDIDILRQYFLSADDDRMLLQTETAGRGWYTLEMPVSIYDNAVRELAAQLPDLDGRWSVVDEIWAVRWMNRRAGSDGAF